MIALLRLICKLIFDVHRRGRESLLCSTVNKREKLTSKTLLNLLLFSSPVSTAHHLDQLEVSLKNQIQTDLIQSRNTMMKDIRRELAETVINTLRSQEVYVSARETVSVKIGGYSRPETVIEQHLLELDDLLWQMNDDEFDSSSIIPTSSSHSSVLSLQVTPHQQSSSSSSTSWKRSVECLYMTPSNNQKSPARCFLTLDHQRRPKSASNLFLADDSLICTSPRVYPMKLYRSEEDITNATEHRGFEFSNGVGAKTFTFEEEDSSCLGSSVRTLMKDFEQSYLRSTLDDLSTIHYSTATTLANNHCEDEEDPSIVAASDSHGTHKLVRNALQLFITPPSTSRTGT